MSRNKGLQKGFAGVITGASTGIGRALAVRLAKKYKARLILNARSVDTLESCAELVRKAGGEAITVAGSVADSQLNNELVQRCVDQFGDIDLLVNNAGFARPGAVTSLTPQDWEAVFAVNFFAPLYATYAALPHFLKKRQGKIVNISSVASKVSFPGSVCYAASKFALTGMSQGMGAELERKGVDVLTVCPGWVRTEFFVKNSVPDVRNPTLIAQKADVRGILMKHLLSISSEECAREIDSALSRGGSSELIMTVPGVILERLQGLAPGAVASLSKLVPVEFRDDAPEPSAG
ncbi:MAG TPA: SDR family oxidoreductase [Planktothrix sp.]|jgi:short-subunit dehydrogenase